MNWYAKKLTEQGPRPAPVQPQIPQSTPPYQFLQSTQSSQYQVYEGHQKRKRGEEALRNGDVMGAVSSWEGGEGARNVKDCPECGGMMFRPSQNAVPQCFNCGWNPRFHQKA